MDQYKGWRLILYRATLLLLGVLSEVCIIWLMYDTYQVLAGNIGFCSLWTDVPGRLSIFLSFYYIAGLSGCLPIPKCILITDQYMPSLWKFWAWKRAGKENDTLKYTWKLKKGTEVKQKAQRITNFQPLRRESQSISAGGTRVLERDPRSIESSRARLSRDNLLPEDVFQPWAYSPPRHSVDKTFCQSRSKTHSDNSILFSRDSKEQVAHPQEPWGEYRLGGVQEVFAQPYSDADIR